VLAQVELGLLKEALRHLVYYRCVTLIDIFQYSNTYVTTPKIQALYESSAL
jgi:hypothetical protein